MSGGQHFIFGGSSWILVSFHGAPHFPHEHLHVNRVPPPRAPRRCRVAARGTRRSRRRCSRNIAVGSGASRAQAPLDDTWVAPLDFAVEFVVSWSRATWRRQRAAAGARCVALHPAYGPYTM
jgi:hypothetical protein